MASFLTGSEKNASYRHFQINVRKLVQIRYDVSISNGEVMRTMNTLWILLPLTTLACNGGATRRYEFVAGEI